jgi:hypothetical protein
LLTLAAAGLLGAAAVSGQQAPGRRQAPARDTTAQRPPAEQAPKGRISGRVVTADTGRPLHRVRILVTTAALPNGRATTTNEDGVYELAQLPAGRYTVNASKAGFITLSYGQRRPLLSGTPLQLGDGQQLSGIDFSLPKGSAIAGHIHDETGEPLPGATVRVLRYQYAQGERQLIPAGTAQTDDQGYYRVWGLNPGEYYVSAMVRSPGIGGRGLQTAAGGTPVGDAIAFGPGVRGGAMAGVFVERFGTASSDAQEPADSVAYPPTYFPGASSVAGAQAITVGLGAEAVNIDFRVLPVRTARITGRVARSNGLPAAGGAIMLRADRAGERRGPGEMSGGLVRGDGTFSIGNVPPGSYVLHFRDIPNGAPQFASEPVTLTEGEVREVNLTAAAGGSIAGSVTFQATQSAIVAGTNQGRVAAQAVENVGPGSGGFARLEPDGTFTIEGIAPGSHWIRWQSGARGWALKSISVGGRDVTDTPVEVKSGQRIAGVVIVMTDRLSSISGTITDSSGTLLTELTVLAFPSDSTLWRPQSRHIMTARPDQNGTYQIRGLPPGEYYLTTIDPVEQGEWFEPAFLDQHRATARRLTLGDGDVKTQDFRVELR